MTAHEDYLGTFVTAIKRGNKVISMGIENRAGKPISLMDHVNETSRILGELEEIYRAPGEPEGK